MEMLEDPETEKKQREGRRCLSRAANIDKAGPPPSLPSSSAHHTSPEKKGGASPKHQWKREWAGSRLGAGGGACPAGPMRTRGAGRLLGREGRRMADAALFEFLHTEMVAELWAQDPDPGPGGQKMSLSVLEGMGFRVGQALGERLPRETLAFREELDALKFLCKDVWAAVFQKQMDSLRTNHQVRGHAQRPRAGEGTPPRGAVAAGPARPRGPAQAGRQARAPSGPLCHPPGEARRLPWGVAAVSSLPAGLPGWAPEPAEGPLRPAAPRLGLMLLVRTWS
ncbi:trafficking protein particle complex subunit 6A isoform X2 [Lagenorhynchus albirostris]|uniref:trafficking protein particle complex subunit 6A isoform X2 n=1 Tax=Lagenorhynchus albirostris TaxID=27610 RepID=UPI0028E59BC8|nr:trafficking protein particle complex subunit 6A isoform X2 [Lagenorhynchus albirostris]